MCEKAAAGCVVYDLSFAPNTQLAKWHHDALEYLGRLSDQRNDALGLLLQGYVEQTTTHDANMGRFHAGILAGIISPIWVMSILVLRGCCCDKQLSSGLCFERVAISGEVALRVWA